MTDKTHVIAFTLYPGVTPLDIVGPLTVLRDLKVRSPYRTVVVGKGIAAHPSDTPMGLVPAATFADVPNPFGLIVPGGGEATLDAMRDDALLEYVRSAGRNAAIVGSTGNGALVLAAAGLLEGRRVATHWAWADVLDRFGATYVDEPWVQDGRFITAGGGTAGVDAMLHLAARLTSRARANLAQLTMEYDPQPPFEIDRARGDERVLALLRSTRTGDIDAGGMR